MKKKFYIVKSLNDLKRLIPIGKASETKDFRLGLKDGLFSRKTLWRTKSGWGVENHIDGSIERGLTDKELNTNTNIVKAIKKHGFGMEI